MISIASIVEGDGEVAALPVLLRRFAQWMSASDRVEPLPPIRVRRDRFLNRDEEFHKQLRLAAAKCGDNGWILIVLDADDDCPATLGPAILRRAQQQVPHRRLSVVLANREFEAWFLAAAHSLNGSRGFSVPEGTRIDAESPRNAKGWMGQHMQGGFYREMLDQPAFTAKMDLQQAFDNSRSFRKLCKEWRLHIQERAWPARGFGLRRTLRFHRRLREQSRTPRRFLTSSIHCSEIPMAKKIWIGIAAALAVVVLTLVIFATLVNVNRYKPQIESLVKEKTGRTLKIEGDLRLSVFPRIALKLPKTTLSDLSGGRVVLEVNSARVGAAWWPLLRGRFELGHLSADGLTATVERRLDGTTNFDDFLPTASAVPAPSVQGGAASSASIGGVTLTRAHLTVDDRMQGRIIELTELNVQTGALAARTSAPIDVDLRYAIRSATAESQAPAPITGELKMSGKLDLDFNNKVFGAQKFDFEIKGLVDQKALEVSAEATRLALRQVPEGHAVLAEDLTFQLKGPWAGAHFDLARVVARKIDVDPMLLDFNLIGFEAEARGSVGASARDAFDFQARVAKLVASREQAGGSALDVSLRLAGSRNLETRLQLDGLAGRASALTASRCTWAFGTTLQDAAGRPRRMHAQFSGPVRASLDALTLALPSFSGEVGMEDGRLPGRGFKLPMDLNAKLDLKQNTLTGNVRMKFDGTPGSADLEVRGLMGDASERQIMFVAKADVLNLDQYVSWPTYPPAPSAEKAAAREQSAARAPQDTPVDWSALAPLNLNAQISVNRMQVHGVQAANVHIAARAGNGRLEIRPLTAALYGGSLNGWAQATADNRLQVHASMVSVSVEPLLRDALGTNLLAGRGMVKIDFTTAGASTLAMRRALEGSAAFGLRDGALKGVNLGKALRESRAFLEYGSSGNITAASANTSAKTDFSEITATFQIENGVATTRDLSGKSPLLRLAGEGQVDLVQSSLDAVARVSVVPTSEGQEGRELADLRGVTVPVRISGPLDAPAYKVDWASTARGTVRRQVQVKIQEQVQDQATPTREELRNKLKGLLGQ